ncbi:MazG family protein [Solimonas sp. K1W22B-7]|uniref:MazG nucleotide pyrophosphohydrolase domain-containing protein n=1 Tax=Solimonas sp. K1W22B-7 TaxID=2303331 RepID=UPI000E334526|nr:MazG nucleotide pyrophosphohydrolase domain-containing protein [Solimonas sp. K1W22B-7]AXQ29189.1 MazG family protein [Solimonas sp. K1W22B-7]
MIRPLAEALRLQREAAELEFDWRHLDELWDKLAEEVGELQQAAGESQDRREDELGDLLFMAVNLARHLGVDAERALARANAKFERRFGHVCKHLAQLPPPGDPRRLDEMERYWQEAKQAERAKR